MSPITVKIGSLTININWDIAISCFVIWSVLVALGVWQLDRESKKSQFLFDQQQREQRPVVDLVSLGEARPSSQQGIRISGRYDPQRFFYLVDQRYLGQEGVEVITPYIYGDGRLVFVSRGWQSVGELAVITDELVEISAYIAPDLPDFLVKEPLSNTQWPIHMHDIDIKAMSQLFDEKVYPYLLRLEEQSFGMLTAHWPKKAFSTRSNWWYAMQWFLIATAFFCFVLIRSSNVIAVVKDMVRQ